MRCVILMLAAMAAISIGKPVVAEAQTPLADARLMRALEDSLWTTPRELRIEAFAKYLAPDYRGVYADGVHDKARELATFPEVRIISYEFADFDGRMVGTGVYGVTYRVSVRGRYKDFRLDGDYWCSSLWKAEGGRWVAVLHTETKVQ